MTSNSPFPLIADDIAIREALANKEEIRFMKQDNGTTVCSYLISMEGTFNSPEAREARGLVFDENGFLISRPLHKFFNVGEREETRIENIDWSQVRRVMDKRDGSMIHTVEMRDTNEHCNFRLKSKKSFASDVAKDATAFIMSNEAKDMKYVEFCNLMVTQGFTAIFEWTSPTARIVLAYPQRELRLLHIRDNYTGHYAHLEALEEASNKYNIPLVDHRDDVLMALIESDRKDLMLQQLVEETEGIEGWVFQFYNGDMVKVKTKWYLERHRAMTFLRVRDIAEAVLNESVDDLKSLLVSEKVDISEILEIEKKVVEEVNYITDRVNVAWLPNKDKDRKDFAITMKGHPYFQLLMRKYVGDEPDVKSWFKKNMLDKMFDLRQINLLQSTAEAE